MASFSSSSFSTNAFSTNAWDFGGAVINYVGGRFMVLFRRRRRS